MPDLEIKNVSKLHIGKGDMLAIQTTDRLSGDGRAALLASVEKFLVANGLKDVPILVLDAGLSVVVVHREEV